jgi:hypothetical protein
MLGLLRFLVLYLVAFSLTPTAFAQTPATNFDGTYTGGVTNVEQIIRNSACGGGGFMKSITVKSGSFALVYNAAHFETIQGTISPDGTVSGYTTSSGGGVRLTAKLQGGSMTGDVTSATCKYSFQLTKR